MWSAEAEMTRGRRTKHPLIEIGCPGKQRALVHRDVTLAGYLADGRVAVRSLNHAASHWLRRHGWDRRAWELHEKHGPTDSFGKCWVLVRARGAK